ncbi:MAG: protoglobin domain-containing protein [Thermodesulfobacteriota bacterium]
METVDKIKEHYHFTDVDAANLVELGPLIGKFADDFVVEFYHHVKDFRNVDKYLKNEATIKRHQGALRKWYRNLFAGDYGLDYIKGLEKVGLAHVKIDLPAHFVNAAFHFVKNFIAGKIYNEVPDSSRCFLLQRSAVKILDINLDVFTSSFIKEEKKFFLSKKVESRLVQAANRFSYGLNLVLVLGLVAIGIMVVMLFVKDMNYVVHGHIETGLLRTLGTLLMLWVVIELMDTEIRHLKGGGFEVRVFVSVALVAIIRDILITTLKEHEAIEARLTLIAAVAVLGGVYWLISQTEKH